MPGGLVRTWKSASSSAFWILLPVGAGMRDGLSPFGSGTFSPACAVAGLNCTVSTLWKVAGNGRGSPAGGMSVWADDTPDRSSATTRLVVAAVGVRRARRGVIGRFL